MLAHSGPGPQCTIAFHRRRDANRNSRNLMQNQMQSIHLVAIWSYGYKICYTGHELKKDLHPNRLESEAQILEIFNKQLQPVDIFLSCNVISEVNDTQHILVQVDKLLIGWFSTNLDHIKYLEPRSHCCRKQLIFPSITWKRLMW